MFPKREVVSKPFPGIFLDTKIGKTLKRKQTDQIYTKAKCGFLLRQGEETLLGGSSRPWPSIAKMTAKGKTVRCRGPDR